MAKAVVKVALPFVNDLLASTTVPCLNVTVPVGVPPNCPATVAVNVTDCVATDGFRLDARAVVVLA